MSFRIIACVIVFSIMCGFQYTLAQDSAAATCKSSCCCAKNDDAPAGIMIAHVHAKNEWMFSARWMNMPMDGLLSGNSAISEEAVFNQYLMAPQTMQMNMLMLMGMYGFTDRLTGMVMMNYNTAYMEMSMYAPGGHHHTGNEQMTMKHTMQSAGLGDTKLYALYGIVNSGNNRLLVSGGVSLPTGSILVKGESGNMMYPNTRLPYAMQLGSGTYDFLPCISYQYKQSRWSASTQVSAVLRTGENSVGYRLGNEYTSNSWISCNWLSMVNSSFRLEGVLAEPISGSDASLYRFAEPAANPVNYGGKRVSGYVGTSVFPLKGAFETLGVSAEYGMPFYQYANGIQMKQRHTLNIALSYGF